MDSKAEVTLTEWFEFNYVSVRKGERKLLVGIEDERQRKRENVYTICKC